MTPLQAFFAIIKGYTTMNIFMLPIGFKAGGWLFSPIMLIISATFEATCAIKLTTAANQVQIYQYTDLVEFCFGRNVKNVFQVLLALLSFQFTFSQLSFFTLTLESLYRVIFHDQKPLWVFMIVTFLIFTPLSWIRTIERFKIGFIFAGITILGMILVVSTFDCIKINEQDNNAGPGW